MPTPITGAIRLAYIPITGLCHDSRLIVQAQVTAKFRGYAANKTPGNIVKILDSGSNTPPVTKISTRSQNYSITPNYSESKMKSITLLSVEHTQ